MVYASKSKVNRFKSVLKNEGTKNCPGKEGRISCLLGPSLPVCRGGRVAEGQVYADDGFPISIAMEAPLLKKLTSSKCLMYKTRRRTKDTNKRSFSFDLQNTHFVCMT